MRQSLLALILLVGHTITEVKGSLSFAYLEKNVSEPRGKTDSLTTKHLEH